MIWLVFNTFGLFNLPIDQRDTLCMDVFIQQRQYIGNIQPFRSVMHYARPMWRLLRSPFESRDTSISVTWHTHFSHVTSADTTSIKCQYLQETNTMSDVYALERESYWDGWIDETDRGIENNIPIFCAKVMCGNFISVYTIIIYNLDILQLNETYYI